jgi:hypothetical protein
MLCCATLCDAVLCRPTAVWSRPCVLRMRLGSMSSPSQTAVLQRGGGGADGVNRVHCIALQCNVSPVTVGPHKFLTRTDRVIFLF